MAAFEFQALDPGGKQRRGVLEGDTPRHVRQLLRDRGWIPLDVEQVAERGGTRRRFGLRAGAGAAEVTLFTRQLATLVGAGTPLEEALRAVGQQTEKAGVRNMVSAVRSRVMEGHSLADGLAQFPGAFPELYRATVAAGEHTGHLDGVLERLADYTERRQYLRQKVQQALIYPIALVLISVAVVVVLLTFVVPEVTGVFENVGQELPLLTRSLIATSDFLRDHGIWLLLALVAAAITFVWALRYHGFRRRVHQSLLRLPLVGRLTRGLNTARFARTLAILAGSGVPVLEALRIAADVIVNIPMRDAVADAASRVREGSGVSDALARSRQFPPMTLHLIASGEGGGNLEGMLERAATAQEREMESLIGMLVALMEPLLIVVMGGVVLVIVMAIMLPIFRLNQLVG